MAEVTAVKKGVEALEREITCAICHDYYQEPKVLPCSHYYCKECIHKMASRTGSNHPFSCPECRAPSSLPQGSLEKLPTAFFVNRMKEVYSQLQKAHGKVQAMCEACGNSMAKEFCRQCAKFFCEDCTRSHQQLKRLFPNHKIVSMDELKEGIANDMPSLDVPVQPCEEHDEPLKMFCFDCRTLICHDCALKTHFGHNHEFVKKVAPAVKRELTHQLESLETLVAKFSSAVDTVKEARSEVNIQSLSVASDIETSVEELHVFLDCHKQELLDENTARTTEKLTHLGTQENELQCSISALLGVSEYASKCLQHLTDHEFVCTHEEVKNRISKVVEQHRLEGELVPVEDIDMGCEVGCLEDFKQLCCEKLTLSQLPIDPTMCHLHVVADGENTVRVGEEFEVCLMTNLGSGKTSKQQCTVEFHLVSTVDGSVVDPVGYRKEGHLHVIKYSPTLRGQHKLSAYINKKEVAESPITLFSSIHPAHLSKPIRVITDLHDPLEVAVNSVGQVIVRESRAIKVFNGEGKPIDVVESTRLQLTYLAGLTIDSTNDHCYITGKSELGFKVCRLDPEYHIVQEVCCGESSWFRGAVIVGEEVMVCDSKNDHIIVFSKDLQEIRQIGSHGKAPGKFVHLRYVAHDHHGNLYVTDRTNHCIQVLSNGGQFLRYIRCNDCEDPSKTPYGVCIFREHVYVTDLDRHTLSVYTTSGDHVTSIGKKGSSEGDFDNPWGVCVDKHGFVYVCDSNNKRVLVF